MIHMTMTHRRRWTVAATAALALVAGMLTGGPAHAAEAPVTVSIDAGGAGGGDFLPDSYFTGGATDINRSGSNGNPNWPRLVTHPIPQEQWNSFRFLESGYSVPNLVPGATYEVRLYFVEWYWRQVGQRVFDVAIDGTTVLDDFDVIQTAVTAGGDGRWLGVERDFPVTVDADGTVDISFIRGSADQPMINAIVLAPVS
jgi:hypothetical protein